jgi:ATP diphosphatase
VSLTNTEELLSIMARLRHPETGCPWDLKQDFRRLAPYAIEEAYEVVDAIERNDMDDLRLELGDLLLQVVFHSQMAEEEGLFTFEQVAGSISQKLMSRHPHVFGSVIHKDDKARQRSWDDAKIAERKAKNKSDEKESVLSGVAMNLPALMYCDKILGKAANHGFDWPHVEPVFEKVLEELDEIKEAWQEEDQAHIQEEVGDLLLVAVNLARHLNVNPEVALKEATHKFSRRFHYIEQQVDASGRSLRECDLNELYAFWNEAKKVLKPE